ncbi:Cysteine proteinase inhibitor 5 [Hibiscus syriacus]|uniref:Cysteine proteinase inhibitor 5 n=1 Tax=Hibiscus syriacus TaxID=106335 RepID=A0A6A3CFT5_HIBSY|nr:Cysteine proteinase inhibitor 5 [Hibiscus syriacus]
MFATIFTAANGYGTIVGGKTPINDVSANKGVVEAGQQIVSGIKYFLKIEATENGEKKTFDAVVLIKPWSQPEERQMLSFSASTQ